MKMSGRLHSGNHSSFAMFFCDILHPCFQCQESGFRVTEKVEKKIPQSKIRLLTLAVSKNLIEQRGI